MCSGGGSVTEVPGGVSGVRGPDGKVADAYRLPLEGRLSNFEYRVTDGLTDVTTTAVLSVLHTPENPRSIMSFSVQPTHYDLIFKTDLEALTFDGEGYIQ